MSVSGNLAMALLRAIKPGRGSFADYEACRKRADQENSSFRFSMPRSSKADFLHAPGTERPCLIIRPRHLQSHSKAVLYLYGGVTNSWRTQRGMAVKYALDTGLETWYPVYPACTEVPLQETVAYLTDIYERMLEHFEADQIAISGASMGGYHALEIISCINHEKLNIPLPGLVIAHSPGGTPDNEADWEEMRKYAQKDPLFSEADLRMTEKLMPQGESAPSWLLTPACFDFSKTPETYIFYGEEMLAGNAVTYRRAFAKAGNEQKLHLEIEKNMMHGYSCLPVFPESRKAYRKTLELIRRM
ncbi:MAG: alpha/beta hydrolase [Solobacterium sp.]|nr:alpha/beta hydrolase [Solobacterium sp.]